MSRPNFREWFTVTFDVSRRYFSRRSRDLKIVMRDFNDKKQKILFYDKIKHELCEKTTNSVRHDLDSYVNQ